MKDIEYKDLPAAWYYCFNDRCTLKDSCLRFLTTALIPENMSTAKVLLPTHYRNEECEHYHEKRTIIAAWGFKKLFYEVKSRDTKCIREEMMNILGSRSGYYRYATGEKLLTPSQQEEIRDVFRKHGYTENLEFDNYTKTWCIQQ